MNLRTARSLRAPTKESTTCPFLKAKTEGMDCTPKAWAVRGFLSTSTATNSTDPALSSTTFSKMGVKTRQGPHQAAQRSTTTGNVAERSRTLALKVASVALFTFSHYRRSLTPLPHSLLASSAMETITGIDVEPVTDWLVKHVGLMAPLRFELIAGGRSNLTFRVTDALFRAVALRRPPVSHVLPTAHDMVREHTVIAALEPLGIPVAKPLGLCVDASVNGAPFYVMEFVDGFILRDREQAEVDFDEVTRATIGEHLAATLANLHDIDVDQAGLGDLARHDGYLERQLRRWRTQYEQMRVDGDDHHRLIEEVGDRLAARVPAQQRTSIVHGDYRLDNTVLDQTGAIAAILDWEICTLGDPLADVGLMLDYWAEPADEMSALLGVAPTTAPGFITRAQLLEAYARHSSLDLSGVAYYQSFGYWKLACILQGVYARYRAGATAGDQGSVADFPTHIATLADLARQILEQ